MDNEPFGERCTCDYPRLRNISGHEEDCPQHVALMREYDLQRRSNMLAEDQHPTIKDPDRP